MAKQQKVGLLEFSFLSFETFLSWIVCLLIVFSNLFEFTVKKQELLL